MKTFSATKDVCEHNKISDKQQDNNKITLKIQHERGGDTTWAS